MPFPIYWTPEKISEVKSLYKRGLSMQEVADELGKSVWCIRNVMLRNNIPRRHENETRRLQFLRSPLSFQYRNNLSVEEEKLKIAGLMLYWGEGAKRHAKTVDLANSDPQMISVFMKFLRRIYQVNESKFRIYLYTHSKESIKRNIQYWSSVTNISSKQFTKPYVQTKYQAKHDKMIHGLIHVRYNDIRLLQTILNDLLKYKICWGTEVVKRA